MNILALIFAIFFTVLAVSFALLCKMRNSWNPTTLLSLGFMVLAALTFWVTTFAARNGQIKMVVCIVLAAAVFLWAIVDFVKKIKSGNYRIHQFIYTLLYLILIAILVLRGFGIHLT